MKAIHYFNKNNKIQKKLDQTSSFYLTNKLGGYLWLDEESFSRYQGWFFTPQETAGERMIKILDNIELPNVKNNKTQKIKNSFTLIKREKEKIKEEFFLSPNFNVLFYKLSKLETIDLIFDIKDTYNNSEEKRIYEIFKEKDLILVKYRHKPSDLLIYVAIKHNGKKHEKLNQWIFRDYYFDKQRNSEPTRRWVYKGLRLRAGRFFAAASFSKEQAKEEVRYVSENFERSKQTKKESLEKVEKLIPESFWKKQKELASGYYCAAYGLNNLTINNSQRIGLYAGLPWFFQFWGRDEMISLKALMEIRPKEAKTIFWRLLDLVDTEGEIEKSSDAIGWTFKRASDFIASKKFKRNEIKQIQKRLERIIDLIFSQKTEDCFVLSDPYLTWMDTLQRDGARIEIQALRLNMYKLARDLSFNVKKENRYYKMEQKLKAKVKEEFWDGCILADGIYPKTLKADFTVTPNIFLAAYIYPDLLSKKEWNCCFEEILPRLWLDWGGLSTIDKNDSRYHPQSTGEIPSSYHHGDSWYFINNLAAIVLFRLNKNKYKFYIKSILSASVEDILWFNAIAGASETASAEGKIRLGCFNQAWSAATYMEMINEMRK